MRLEARIKKIEDQVGDGKSLTLWVLLKCFPKGQDGGIRQLLIDRLPHTGPVNPQDFLALLPENLQEAIIQRLMELSHEA